jgi:hypothetical protein
LPAAHEHHKAVEQSRPLMTTKQIAINAINSLIGHDLKFFVLFNGKLTYCNAIKYTLKLIDDKQLFLDTLKLLGISTRHVAVIQAMVVLFTL